MSQPKFASDSRTAEATRKRILSCSLSQFSHAGFEGVSMRSVASSVGVTPAALYYHFPDKETLYLCVVEYCFNKHVYKALIEAEKYEDAWQRLEVFIHSFVNILTKKRQFQRLMQWVLLDTNKKRIQALANNLFTPFFDRLTHMIKEIQPNGDSHMLVVSLLGLAVFPFETINVRRVMPDYDSTQEHSDKLTNHIMTLLRQGLMGSTL